MCELLKLTTVAILLKISCTKAGEKAVVLCLCIRSSTKFYCKCVKFVITEIIDFSRPYTSLMHVCVFCSPETEIFNGFEYMDVREPRAYQAEAEQYCSDWGGHLASITSQTENEFLRKYTQFAYNCNGRLAAEYIIVCCVHSCK